MYAKILTRSAMATAILEGEQRETSITEMATDI